ncbi:MAG: YerI protein [Clostridia bacterium]|nr:YerI protein [Clostridia bacterium]
MVSEELLKLAANAYDFNTDTLNYISGSTNEIYSFSKEDKGYILRFAKKPVECINQTIAEMDWIYYLSSNKINASLPLKTNGKLAMSAKDNNEHFIITAFERANGIFWDKNDKNRWNSTVFFNWGKVMGDIHTLTKKYQPSDNSNLRSAFSGKDALSDSIKTCPSVSNITQDLVKQIFNLPKDKDSYGLIHYDLHPWNFLIDGDKINVFDFDDCLYGWFTLDIGIALYHALWWGRLNDAEFNNSIIKSFIKGYLSSNKLDDFWLQTIPMFMSFRQICKFSWFFNSNNINDELKEEIDNIENNILFKDYILDKSLFKINTYIE